MGRTESGLLPRRLEVSMIIGNLRGKATTKKAPKTLKGEWKVTIQITEGKEKMPKEDTICKTRTEAEKKMAEDFKSWPEFEGLELSKALSYDFDRDPDGLFMGRCIDCRVTAFTANKYEA